VTDKVRGTALKHRASRTRRAADTRRAYQRPWVSHNTKFKPRPVRTHERKRVTTAEREADPERAVPAASAEGHAVRADAEAADAVLVAGEDADTLTTERVPDIARPVVVPAEQNAARDGERDGGDAAQDVVVREDVQLTVRTDVEQPARGVV
jgi:hypothetical protein